MSQRLFFIIAMLSIGIGVLGLSGVFQTQPSTASPVSHISYQVAQLKEPLKKGQILESGNFRYFRINEETALEKGVSYNTDISINPGMVAKRSISTKEYLSQNDFINPDDPGYVDAVIKTGMIPYSLTIEKKMFIGSGISVGDKVDIMILTSDDQNIGESSRNKFIESFRTLSVSPLLQNVRILAIDEENNELLPLTIELDRAQVAKMVIARRIGILEVIKSTDKFLRPSLGLSADTHDVLPNFKSVTEIRGQQRAFN
ncbi:Flp pilus assembly protein CpaB [Grimontia kaedaensis]|uniref:Flp pilus assembly protein CpaB n=1 Tax=Grimontia kaedaensis TaxID=2872157 RepID=A0ABY4X1J5_9GAMM|nr:Flp pilus assembly protein CpaB [Grimontia kaedaensis]USH05081.1 Flp pilus assembly protein CpaB [Grimontia kaedaensis]